MSRESRKLEYAHDAIASAIKRGDFSGSLLPSAGVLAQTIGVSASTVLKAIRALRKQGRLTGKPGNRHAFPDCAPGFALTDCGGSRLPARRTKEHALRSRIQQDILNGRFRHDSALPSDKELTARYGVSPMTLRKALRALADQGVLSRRGVRFSPVSMAAPAHRRNPRIVLLGQGGNMQANILWGYAHQEYFKLMELECAKSGYHLDVVCFSRSESGPRLVNGRTWDPCSLDDKSGVEGYIYEVTGTQSMDDDLLLSVTMGGRPVAILDEVGGWPSRDFLKRHPNVRVFRNTVSDLPAQKVARFVLELGHRTAVYISPHHHLEYSRLRYAGLAQAFSMVEGARIVPITSQDESDQAPLPAKVRVAFDKLRRFRTGLTKGLPPGYRDALSDHFDPLGVVADQGRTQEILYRLCDQALAIEDATVWIPVNDFCAHWANSFLDTRQLSVPADLSIISFDDNPVGLAKSIASYNFNSTAMVIALLRFITNPRLFPVSRPVIEIEGNVIPRQTMGRPRNR